MCAFNKCIEQISCVVLFNLARFSHPNLVNKRVLSVCLQHAKIIVIYKVETTKTCIFAEIEASHRWQNHLTPPPPHDVSVYLRFYAYALYCYRGKAESLFGQPSEAKKYKMVEALPRDPSPVENGDITDHGNTGERNGTADHLVVEHASPDKHMEDIVPKRSTHQITRLIKEAFKNDFQRIEEEFQNLDEKNTQRLTQEMMYQLLKR